MSNRIASGVTWLSSGILRVAGTALLVSAVWLWMTPGSLADAEGALLKLVASMFFLLLGGVLVQAGRDHGRDEYQFDGAKHEIRHLLRGANGFARFKARYHFTDLSDVRVDDGMFLARDRFGRVVLNRPTRDMDAAQVVDRARQNGLIRKA